jgi:hypothetical protein
MSKKSKSAKGVDDIDPGLIASLKGRWQYDADKKVNENFEALVATEKQFSEFAPELHKASWMRAISGKANPTSLLKSDAKVDNSFDSVIDDYVETVVKEPKGDVIFKNVSLKPTATASDPYMEKADKEVARIAAMLKRASQ